MCSTNTDGCHSSPSALSVQLSAVCEVLLYMRKFKLWDVTHVPPLQDVARQCVRIPLKTIFPFFPLANVLWSHYHHHTSHINSHTLIDWLLDGNRKGQSLSLSWRNMASEWRVRSNLWTGLQPVVVRCSFHPFPQHGGTSIHNVDVVREQHGCSTSRRSHGQDTRCAEVCAIVILYITGAVVHSYTYLSRNSCCEWLFNSRGSCYFLLVSVPGFLKPFTGSLNLCRKSVVLFMLLVVLFMHLFSCLIFPDLECSQ